MKVMSFAAFGLTVMAVATIPVAKATEREVTYIPSEKTAAAFLKGMPLVEKDNYKVHASRRAGPGQVEVHTKDTDIIYVLTGSATFVAGGTISGGKDVGPEEIRGSTIDQGETRTLKPGDIVIVPNGTPHWFKEVPAPMTYFVVKVRAVGDTR